ncbi:MAG: hypothetical protein NZ520_03880 [bacterium]|nr:hypothetical protein [bacterium]
MFRRDSADGAHSAQRAGGVGVSAPVLCQTFALEGRAPSRPARMFTLEGRAPSRPHGVTTERDPPDCGYY